MAARARELEVDPVHGDITIERRVRGRDSVVDLLAVDEPFDDLEPASDVTARRDLLQRFLAYLRAQHVPEQYLPQFEAEALAFCTRFAGRPLEKLDAGALDAYLDEARAAALPERTLRNRRVACDAFVGFLREHLSPEGTRPEPPPVAAAPAAPACKPAEMRRAVRTSFITDVLVENLGVLRSADLGAGGMYLELISPIGRGTVLRASFKLHPTDPSYITVTARVAFVHPHLGAGLEFVQIAPADRKRIEAHVVRAERGR